MHYISDHTYDGVLEKQLDIVLHGDKNESLGTTEIFNVFTNLSQPRNRWCTSQFRKHNIFSTIAEVVWVLSGHDDMDFLTRYLPRAASYSDDGEVWGGAYGPRLRGYAGINRQGNRVVIDPLVKCLNRLHNNSNTRQAVINIWDNAKEHTEEFSKDYCCNVALNFYIRNNKLHMTVFQRSQDIIWGSMVNYVEWTILQEVMSSILEVNLGEYNHFVTNLHLYSSMEDRANAVLLGYSQPKESGSREEYHSGKFETIKPGESILSKVGEFDELVNSLYWIGSDIYTYKKSKEILEEYLNKYPILTTTLSVFLLHKNSPSKKVRDLLENNLNNRKDTLNPDFLKAIELSK